MTTTSGWILLVASGVIDVIWAITMKKSDGFTDIRWSLISLVLLAAFVILLTKALQVLPVGTAYAVWTGIGAAGTALLGMVLFGEPASPLRIACIGVTVAGIIGLNLTS